MTDREVSYRFLTPAFFENSLSKQIAIIYRDREHFEKVYEFKVALARGDVRFSRVLTRQEVMKLLEVGIPVPTEYTPE